MARLPDEDWEKVMRFCDTLKPSTTPVPLPEIVKALNDATGLRLGRHKVCAIMHAMKFLQTGRAFYVE